MAGLIICKCNSRRVNFLFCVFAASNFNDKQYYANQIINVMVMMRCGIINNSHCRLFCAMSSLFSVFFFCFVNSLLSHCCIIHKDNSVFPTSLPGALWLKPHPHENGNNGSFFFCSFWFYFRHCHSLQNKHILRGIPM